MKAGSSVNVTFTPAMRERGLKPTGCNCLSRAINAYLKWSGSTRKIRPFKEPDEVLPTFTEQQVKRLIAWKLSLFCRGFIAQSQDFLKNSLSMWALSVCDAVSTVHMNSEGECKAPLPVLQTVILFRPFCD